MGPRANRMEFFSSCAVSSNQNGRIVEPYRGNSVFGFRLSSMVFIQAKQCQQRKPLLLKPRHRWRKLRRPRFERTLGGCWKPRLVGYESERRTDRLSESPPGAPYSDLRELDGEPRNAFSSRPMNGRLFFYRRCKQRMCLSGLVCQAAPI